MTAHSGKREPSSWMMDDDDDDDEDLLMEPKKDYCATLSITSFLYDVILA